MTSRATDLPVRIGLIGLGPTGAYHLERISLRDDLRLVTACDSCADTIHAHPLFRELASSPTDVLARTDVDYVLVAAPQKMRCDLVLRALEAGKNVAVDGPPCLDSGEARSLLAASRRTGRTVCVLPTRRDGFDFRAARHMVQSGRLGRIEAARILTWAKAVPLELFGAGRRRGIAKHCFRRRSVHLFCVSVRRSDVATGWAARENGLRQNLASARVRFDSGGIFHGNRVSRRR